MHSLSIQLNEKAGIARKNEPVRLGVPIPQGWATSIDYLSLLNDATGRPLPGQFTPLSYWPDSSIRWLQTCFLAQLDAMQSKTISLTFTDKKAADDEIQVSQNGSQLLVNTGSKSFLIDQEDLTWQPYDTLHKVGSNASRIGLKDSTGTTCTAVLKQGWIVTDIGSVMATLNAQGEWRQSDGAKLACFECNLHFFKDSSSVTVEVTIHNPKRAHHPGGLWDLGDAGSIHFIEHGLEVETGSDGNASIEATASSNIITAEPGQALHIYQDSSGGENWNSRNHTDASGQLITQFKGYRVSLGANEALRGNRATPIIFCGGEHPIQASIKGFWQNFPSAISAHKQRINIDLFPADGGSLFELQGGEQKTHTCYIDYSDNAGALNWTRYPLTPTIASDQYEAANAFPWFKANAQQSALDDIIVKGIQPGPANFFSKREVIDEYGWRNFGDIFADHETLYQQADDAPYISHYNNQYDAIYGFARQYALTGNPLWFELMDDLARHVADIDIYHTSEDRSEYNQGLFWHTDHYLDAHTATHRTYTKHNDTSSIPGQTGGGPAAEHCYSSGLLYHYFLTGNKASYEAVLGLANWMVALHEGTGGLLEQVFAFVKHDLPKLKALLGGDQPFLHTYPFTRGTGNYINTLLDAWLATNDKTWLQRAESVIKSTIHPSDNIDQRHLLTVETGWSYLILINSIGKYLSIKQETEEFDDSFIYTLASFRHYTRWMVSNEQSFLADPKQLEFPNDTWTAQDIRKAMLMYQAAHFDTAWQEKYRSKAEQWFKAVIDKLKTSEEGHYARILIILMQNYGPHHSEMKSNAVLANNIDQFDNTPSPQLNWSRLFARIISRLARGLIQFRPSRERAWLNARLNKP
jgi:hypothetical protein